MSEVVVVGGNGFIGYHLVQALMDDGWGVTVYDRAIRSRFGDSKHRPAYVQGEVGNRELLREHLSKANVVFHLACTTIPKTSNDDPAYDVQSNVVTTVNMLAECVEAEVDRVVFLSSGGTVYGVPEHVPISEDHPKEPICSYGITKLMIERYLLLFHRLHGLPFAILRPANPYGGQQNFLGEQGAVTVFLGRIARGLPIEIWGDGSVTRDYFHVKDLVRGCILAAESDIPKLIVNLGSGQGLSLNDLLQVLRNTIGEDFEVRYQIGRPFDVPELILDIGRARRVLDWEPSVSLEAGIEMTWDWIQSELHNLQ